MKGLLALFAAALCTTAVADDPTRYEGSSRSADRQFDTLDSNADNRLSRTEAQEDESLAADFASIDQDADGTISKSEYAARLDSGDSGYERQPMDEEPIDR